MVLIAELTRLIPPPTTPVAARGDWSKAEAEVALTFPDDYKQVVEAYGTGRFFNFLWVYSPFDPASEWRLSNQLHLSADNLRAYKAEGFGVPLPIYPEPGGLVNFGSTENCNLLNWVATGESNGWGLAIWDPCYLAIRSYPELTVSGLLTLLARHLLPRTPDGHIFPEDLFQAPSFVSEAHNA